MRGFEDWALAYLVNSLWQVPLVFLGAWLAARLAMRIGAGAEHRIWVCALLAEIALPACPVHPGDLWSMLKGLLVWSNAAGGGDTRVILGPGSAAGAGALHLPAPVLIVLLIAYCGAALYLTFRLIWGLVITRRMMRGAEPLLLDQDLALCWSRTRSVFATMLHNPKFAPEIATSANIGGPVTVGTRMLLLPPAFLENIAPADLDALLAHEFAHMARRDFFKNLAYGVLSLPVAWHPAVAITRARLAESRERVCDVIAAEAVAGRQRYARSLLRLASMLSTAAPAGALHALGIFDSNNLERRIMNLTRNQIETRGVRRLAILALCAAMGAAACASALALRMEVNQPSQNAKNIPTHVDIKNLKIISKVPPVYPPQAKADRLSGKVTLDAVIGKDGSVENLKVVKSLREDCDQNAIDAVRQWKFEPFLLNGQPIEVKTTINIIYWLKK